MPIEKREHVGGSRSVVVTECPFCGDKLPKQTGLATHLDRCQEL